MLCMKCEIYADSSKSFSLCLNFNSVVIHAIYGWNLALPHCLVRLLLAVCYLKGGIDYDISCRVVYPNLTCEILMNKIIVCKKMIKIRAPLLLEFCVSIEENCKQIFAF